MWNSSWVQSICNFRDYEDKWELHQKNRSWSWACLQLSSCVCYLAFQINSQLPSLIKGQKGGSAPHRHLARIFFPLKLKLCYKNTEVVVVLFTRSSSMLGHIAGRMVSGMMCFECLTQAWAWQICMAALRLYLPNFSSESLIKISDKNSLYQNIRYSLGQWKTKGNRCSEYHKQWLLIGSKMDQGRGKRSEWVWTSG